MNAPSPAELAAFLRATGGDMPTRDFIPALRDWRRWARGIQVADAKLRIEDDERQRDQTRIPFADARRRLAVQDGTMRDYWDTATPVWLYEDPDAEWEKRRKNGIPAGEVALMEAERDRRLTERARAGGIKKAKQKR